MADVLSNLAVIGTAGGVLTAASMVPQLIKLVKNKKAEDVSVRMIIVLLFGVGLWVYYGALKKDLPVLLTNSFSFLVNIAMAYVSVKYKTKER